MHRRHSLAHLILGIVVALGLTPLMIVTDAQAQIAFASDRDGNLEIYVMGIDGGNLRRLTNNPDGDWDPSWSPDGKRIAFMSGRDGHVDGHGAPIPEIYVMDANGDNQKNLTNNPSADRSPSWSPDGSRIAFMSDRDGGYDIYVMDADGSNQQNLSNHPFSDRNPSWSPDGAQIVFSARRDGHVENEAAITHEIYVMGANGGNQRNLTNDRHNDRSPSWSPDGKRLAFVSDRDWLLDKDGWPTNEIYVMDADGGDPQNLSNNRHGNYGPAWFSPTLAVAPAGEKFTMWGWLKRVD